MKKLFQQEKTAKTLTWRSSATLSNGQNFARCTCIIMIMQDDAGGEAAYSSIIMIMQL